MQILNKTIKFTGTEKGEISIGVKVGEGLVFVLDNRGPATLDLTDIGPLEPNRFLVVSGVEHIKIHPPAQFTTLDVSVFTK